MPDRRPESGFVPGAEGLFSFRRRWRWRRCWRWRRGSEERLVDGHWRLLLQFFHCLLGQLRPDLLLDIGTDFIERLHLMLLHQDQVVAELGFDRLSNLADGRCKGGLVERRDHLAVAEEIQVAAVSARSGI